MHRLSDELETALASDDRRVVSLPALVKGELIHPPKISYDALLAASAHGAAQSGNRVQDRLQWFETGGAQVIRLPTIDRSTLQPTGEDQFLVLPAADPQSLIETDRHALAHGLYAMPFREVMAYVGELRDVLQAAMGVINKAAGLMNATSQLHDRAADIFFDLLPDLLDPEALAAAVDRELRAPEAPGREYLDGWVPVSAEAHRGMTARMSEQFLGQTATLNGVAETPRVRAIPTRQLHITAGNSPVVPILSFLRAVATKGASVIKSAAEVTPILAILAVAMRAVDPHHPITRHTSLVYWKGGDRSVEDALFSPNAFDRVVIWGSPETIRSVGQRVRHTKTVFLNPRYGISLIGRQAFPDHLEEAAIRAAADSMIANQQACISSLVHYVEASEAEALEYCRTLKTVLAKWDHYLPHRLPDAARGRLQLLRRNEFLHGTWFENGVPPNTSSLVVYMPDTFNLSAHPMSRFIVVRRVDLLDQALVFLNSAVAAVGIYPESVRTVMRDEIAAMGVSNILPLGECERGYAGMPHDGMRMLSELVNWTSC